MAAPIGVQGIPNGPSEVAPACVLSSDCNIAGCLTPICSPAGMCSCGSSQLTLGNLKRGISRVRRDSQLKKGLKLVAS